MLSMTTPAAPSPPLPYRSVLYQRGVYPPESFSRTAKYGITMLLTEDEGLKEYLNGVIKHLRGGHGRPVLGSSAAAGQG